jgi:(5-formylfuran-3-yl)methyl phosphate synthase
VTRLLASVTDLAESRIALAGGADLIDFKDPRRGALGALPAQAVAEFVAALGPSVITSATVGDLPPEPARLLSAVEEMAATGVSYVKLGFFGRGVAQECLDTLAPLARRHRLVAVLFADLGSDLSAVPALARAGFAGVMLDTAGKDGRGLRDCMTEEEIARFVTAARGERLLTGLAGSLKASDIPALLPFAPDYLGFRGALCAGGERTAALDPDALREVRARIPRRNAVAA